MPEPPKKPTPSDRPLGVSHPVLSGRPYVLTVHLTGWIELELKWTDDKPVAGQAYRLTLSDGKIVEGKLDAAGVARHDKIPHGQCKVEFPGIDMSELMPAQKDPPKLPAWIEIELKDEDGTPIAGREFELVRPDGERVEGKTDAAGLARLESLPEGDCLLTWKTLDRRLVHPAKETIATLEPPPPEPEDEERREEEGDEEPDEGFTPAPIIVPAKPLEDEEDYALLEQEGEETGEEDDGAPLEPIVVSVTAADFKRQDAHGLRNDDIPVEGESEQP